MVAFRMYLLYLISSLFIAKKQKSPIHISIYIQWENWSPHCIRTRVDLLKLSGIVLQRWLLYFCHFGALSFLNGTMAEMNQVSAILSSCLLWPGERWPENCNTGIVYPSPFYHLLAQHTEVAAHYRIHAHTELGHFTPDGQLQVMAEKQRKKGYF